MITNIFATVELDERISSIVLVEDTLLLVCGLLQVKVPLGLKELQDFDYDLVWVVFCEVLGDGDRLVEVRAVKATSHCNFCRHLIKLISLN